MSFTVDLTCRGTREHGHLVRRVATFRYDDGWARVGDKQNHDAIVQMPNGEMGIAHRLTCNLCTRREVLTPKKLYPLLDYARKWGNDEVPLQ